MSYIYQSVYYAHGPLHLTLLILDDLEIFVFSQDKLYNYHILGTLDFQVQSIGLHAHVICLWAHVQPWILTWARLWVTILCLHCRSQCCAVLSSICRWWISARSHSLLYSTTTSSWTFLPCTPCSVVAIY